MFIYMTSINEVTQKLAFFTPSSPLLCHTIPKRFSWISTYYYMFETLYVALSNFYNTCVYSKLWRWKAKLRNLLWLRHSEFFLIRYPGILLNIYYIFIRCLYFIMHPKNVYRMFQIYWFLHELIKQNLFLLCFLWFA